MKQVTFHRSSPFYHFFHHVSTIFHHFSQFFSIRSGHFPFITNKYLLLSPLSWLFVTPFSPTGLHNIFHLSSHILNILIVCNFFQHSVIFSSSRHFSPRFVTFSTVYNFSIICHLFINFHHFVTFCTILTIIFHHFSHFCDFNIYIPISPICSLQVQIVTSISCFHVPHVCKTPSYRTWYSIFFTIPTILSLFAPCRHCFSIILTISTLDFFFGFPHFHHFPSSFLDLFSGILSCLHLSRGC